MLKLALRAQTVDIAYLPLRQDLLAKNVLMTAQRVFGLGNSLSRADPTDVAMTSWRSSGVVRGHIFGPSQWFGPGLVKGF